MRKVIPPSIVDEQHVDFPLLSSLADEIFRRAGGSRGFRQAIPGLLREVIDDVIQTPRTGRLSYDELEKTEKTYIGTRVEIMLRSALDLPKGKLDTVLLGTDVDIKHTMGNNWMIPVEAIGYPCILVAADENSGLCYFGLIVARLEYLTAGTNRDSKRSISSAGFKNIFWLMLEEPYPQNFWSTIPSDTVERIFEGESGNDRVVRLFREVQRRPISREIVNATARQKDFTRRIRADAGHGTRDLLAREGILLLSGSYGKDLITKFGLPKCGRSEFISYTVSSDDERVLARNYGFDVP